MAVAGKTFALDTSAYSAFNRGDASLLPFFHSANTLLISLIVVGELRAGFALGSKHQENEMLLRRFLDSPNVSTLSLSDATTRLFADLFRQLKRAGTPIGTNDLWIAALALEHACPLVTLDSDFSRVPNLTMYGK